MYGQTTLEPAAGPSRPAAREDARRSFALRAAVGAAVLVLACLAAWFLFGHAEPRVAGITPTFPQEEITTLEPGREVCQYTRVPAGTGAVQVLTPRPDDGVSLVVRPRERGAGATAARAAAAPDLGLRLRLDRTVERDLVADVCLRSARASVPLLGDRSNRGLSVAGRAVPAALALTFYRPGKETAAQMIPVLAARIGRMRGAFGGSWRLPVIVLLLAGGLAATGWLLLRGVGARRRRLLGALFAVAACNALAWSLFTPVLQIPDEPAHLSYVQDLVEKGQPPQPFGSSLSPELNVVVDGALLGYVNFRHDARPPWSAADDRAIAARLATHPSRRNPAWYLPVSDYPPAYYAAVAPVYRAVTAAGGSTLDAITPLRAVSGLLSGIAVIAVFGFLLELFPERRFEALAIALVCAYQPVLTYISGGVTPDSLLIPLGAATFWLFARSFTRGLTVPRAAGLGLLLAAMLLTKIAALGLVPGWLAGVALLLWRARGARVRPLAAAALCAAVPLAAYALLNAGPWNRPVLPTGLTGGGGDAGPVVPGPTREVSSFAVYLWEYVLPRFGSMTDFFHSSWAPKDLWVPIWLGRFGWSDYGYPNVVNRGALIVYAIIAVAALVGLWRLLRQRGELWAPIAVSALLGLGLIGAIAKAGYPLRASGNFIFEQGRYYLPVICLFALALALAASLLRRRAAHALIVAFVLVSIVQLGGALGMTVNRYYTFSSYLEQQNAHDKAR